MSPAAAGTPGGTDMPSSMPASSSAIVATGLFEAFAPSKQRYTAPRLTDELRDQGERFTVNALAASLRRQGRRAQASRKFNLISYRAHGLPVPEDLLNQDFSASGPHQEWAGDIASLRTNEGWLYLAAVTDLWSRVIAGWSFFHQ